MNPYTDLCIARIDANISGIVETLKIIKEIQEQQTVISGDQITINENFLKRIQELEERCASN